MASTCSFIVHESGGSYCLSGPESNFVKRDLGVDNEDENESRFVVPAPNGRNIAVGKSNLVYIIEAENGNILTQIRSKILLARFSPDGGYLTGWNNPNQNIDNFNIWDVNDRSSKLAPNIYHQKTGKYPDFHFSGDDKIFARLVNNSVSFYEVPNFTNVVKKSPESIKISNFSLSGGQSPLHVLFFIKSTPSQARLYRYPDFDTLIGSKSFFQGDRIDMKWNPKGNGVLIITSTEVDKTGESYYGKSMLHYMNTKGETAQVQTVTEAPIVHSCQWSPNSTEFCIITGKMPNVRVAILNSKCDIVFDMGIDVQAKNAIHFNPHGNLLLLTASGNLSSGLCEVWEVKKYKKKITTFNQFATSFSWLNDGVHFVTAVTAPRMQVGNLFKVFDFTGKEKFSFNAEKHLFGVTPFYSFPPLPFPESKLDEYVKKVESKPVAQQKKEAANKPVAYIPPSRRGLVGMSATKGALIQSPKVISTNKNKPNESSNQLSEKDKKIKAVKKKLEAIEKLVEQQKQGKTLEKNQLEKITKESELLQELEELQLQ